jgi:hypothetical protein
MLHVNIKLIVSKMGLHVGVVTTQKRFPIMVLSISAHNSLTCKNVSPTYSPHHQIFHGWTYNLYEHQCS